MLKSFFAFRSRRWPFSAPNGGKKHGHQYGYGFGDEVRGVEGGVVRVMWLRGWCWHGVWVSGSDLVMRVKLLIVWRVAAEGVGCRAIRSRSREMYGSLRLRYAIVRYTALVLRTCRSSSRTACILPRYPSGASSASPMLLSRSCPPGVFVLWPCVLCALLGTSLISLDRPCTIAFCCDGLHVSVGKLRTESQCGVVGGDACVSDCVL